MTKSTMKSIFIGAMFWLLSSSLLAAESDALYGQHIFVPAKMRPELQAAVADLKSALKQMTGKEFSSSSELKSAGIHLTMADNELFPGKSEQLLPAESREACALWPESEQKLWIVARSDLGLTHGIYLYLEQLGCRWYFPSPRWTIIPQRADIRLTKPIKASPAFRSRVFAGSGGFGGNLPLDPKRQLQARWTDWQRRNRFGGEFRVAGHSGEAFNLKHRKELEAHPEWRAMVNGERVPWSLISKFCAGNQEVVDLYVKDRVEDYRFRQKRDPDDPNSWAVSVEPADGGGHCTAPESLALGSVSDRVFHVANQVARAVRKEFPEGHVSLFAYNEHATVPAIDIEPNVYVQVIPYAFQRTGLTPDQLLDAWSKKVLEMGIYDYWSIPDWSHDLPTFDPLGFGPERLRGWRRRGVDSFLCESTFSSGAMGPAWYIGSRVAWQPETDVEALFTEFTRDCFGPGAKPMERMLRRWSAGFYLTSHELALSYRDLQDAWKLAEGRNGPTARIADYGRYVVYLQRYHEHQLAKRGSPEKQAAAERLMRHLWSVYDSSMIHAFRLSQLLARDEKTAGNPQLAETFNWQDPAAPGWQTIKPLSDEEVRGLISDGVAKFAEQSFVVKKYQGKSVRLLEKVAVDNGDAVLTLSNTLEFQVLAERVDYIFQPKIATEKPVQMLITDPDGNTVSAAAIETGANWRTEWSQPEYVLRKAGIYQFQIVSQKRPFRFAPPKDAILTMPGWNNSQGNPTPRLHFYVTLSRGHQLAIYTPYIAAGPPRFFDPDGKEVKPTLVDEGHLMLIQIPENQSGKVWSLDRAKCPNAPLVMLNAPSGFAFSPGALLVPKSALPELVISPIVPPPPK